MSDLDRLLAALRASAPEAPDDDDGAPAHPQPQPSPRPPPQLRAGQPPADWLREVAAARAAHDARALAHRERLDRTCERLFGTSLAGLLGEPGQVLVRESIQVELPPDLSMRSLVPGIDGGFPQGPELSPGVSTCEAVTVHLTSPPKPTAAVIRLHGGAFWMGGGQVPSRIDRVLVDHLAAAANAAVLDVDYHLAPEHPFPQAVLETLAVADWVRAGGDGAEIARPAAQAPIAIVGTSSGGNVATVAARLEGARGHRIAALGLVVPSVQLSVMPAAGALSRPARAARLELLRCYLGDIDPADPWVSPGVLARLDGMPPTFAAVAELDEVAAGGADLCAAIRRSGQVAEVRTYPMTHVVATPQTEASLIADLGRFLADRLHPAAGEST